MRLRTLLLGGVPASALVSASSWHLRPCWRSTGRGRTPLDS